MTAINRNDFRVSAHLHTFFHNRDACYSGENLCGQSPACLPKTA